MADHNSIYSHERDAHSRDVAMDLHDIPAEVRSMLVILAQKRYNAATLSRWYQIIFNQMYNDIEHNTVAEYSQSPGVESNHTQAAAAATDSKFLCPVCWTAFRQSKDCKRHAKGHWIRYDCTAPNCTASYLRPDHFIRHHRGNTGHTCTAKKCNHVGQAATVTSSWVALGCGFCEKVFTPELTGGVATHVAMHTTHNDYMNHLFQHYIKGSTALDWSADQKMRSLLCQPSIQPLWHELCSARFKTNNSKLWPTLRWTDDVSNSFSGMLEFGLTSAGPSLNLASLLEAGLGQYESQLSADVSSLFLPSLPSATSAPDNHWFSAMATGFDIDPNAMMPDNVSCATHLPTASTPVASPGYTMFDTEDFNNVMENTSTTYIDTHAADFTFTQDTKDSDHPPVSPAGSFIWSAGEIGNDLGLVGTQPFARDTAPDPGIHHPFYASQNAYVTTPTSDSTSNTQALSLGGNSLLHTATDAMAIFPSEQIATVLPSTIQFNTASPNLEHSEQILKKGHKRPLSGVSEHIKRLNRTIFHR